MRIVCDMVTCRNDSCKQKELYEDDHVQHLSVHCAIVCMFSACCQFHHLLVPTSDDSEQIIITTACKQVSPPPPEISNLDQDTQFESHVAQ